jgi:hypothetical protein
LLPKLLFAFAYLAFAIRVFGTHGEERPRSRVEKALLFAWLGNPYIWVEIPHYGHFDVLVGILCVAAVEARVRGRDILSGSYLAVGILIKYVPMFLIPFVARDGPRFRWRLILSAAGLTAAGLGVSALIWGRSTFRPIVFAAGRPTNHLSIYRFLNGPHSPLGWFDFPENLANWAPEFLLIALGLVLVWSNRRGAATLPSAVLAMVVTAVLYQAGFTQYHMVPFILSTWWVAVNPPEPWRRRILAAALVPYYGWLGAFDLLDCFDAKSVYGILDWAGLVTFVLGSILVAAIHIAAGDRSAAPDAEGRIITQDEDRP